MPKGQVKFLIKLPLSKFSRYLCCRGCGVNGTKSFILGLSWHLNWSFKMPTYYKENWKNEIHFWYLLFSIFFFFWKGGGVTKLSSNLVDFPSSTSCSSQLNLVSHFTWIICFLSFFSYFHFSLCFESSLFLFGCQFYHSTFLSRQNNCRTTFVVRPFVLSFYKDWYWFCLICVLK